MASTSGSSSATGGVQGGYQVQVEGRSGMDIDHSTTILLVPADEGKGLVDKEMMDLEERKRRECEGNMEKIEKEFADLKEKFFTDKIESLKRDYELIKSGSHQGFLKKCKELEELRQHKLWAAEKWREYQFLNLEHTFEAEKLQAEDEFEMAARLISYKADKKALREKMMNIANEKKKRLIDEKNSMNLIDTTDKLLSRSFLKRNNESKEQVNPKRRPDPPQINYTLQENEISDDLSLIQRGLSNNPAAFVKYTASPKSSTTLANTSDVYTDRGKLYYHSQVFDKGKDVFIESKIENGRWQGTIVVVNPAEIHIKSNDGTKSRFSLSQLRNGKYTITAIS